MSYLRLLNDHLLIFKAGTYASKIQLENDREFRPPSSGMWITQNLKVLPPKLIGAFVDGGQYRLMANYELGLQVSPGGGMPEARDEADLLVNHFRRGLVLNNGSSHVKVEKSFQGDSLSGPDKVTIPVTVTVWSYKPY